MGLKVNGTDITDVQAILNNTTQAINVVNVISGGVTSTVWARLKVIFDTGDTYKYRWRRDLTANNGWGKATCQTNNVTDTWNKLDCTNYKYCTVRIKGSIDSLPSGSTSNSTDIRIGFTEDYTKAVTVVTKWADGSGESVSQDGLAYGKWYDLTLDISALTGVQSLNVFIGGAYQNSGTLDCSKITMHS